MENPLRRNEVLACAVQPGVADRIVGGIAPEWHMDFTYFE